MQFQLELWQLLSLLLTLITVLIGLGRLLLSQIQKSLDLRFASIEGQASAWQSLEREFLRFQAEMAVQYVRREDYVRGQSVIEAKLDAIASELKRVQIDGAKQGNHR
ncbi:MAG: hypothetical protein ACTS5I_02875 [Rhodanobacter sp.]